MPTQHDVLDRYFTHLLAAGRGTGTVDLRRRHLRYLAEDHPDLLKVTRHELERYLAVRRDSHSPATRRSLLASFRSFFAWATAEELIGVDPAAKLAGIRGNPSVPRVAPDADLARAMQSASVEEQTILLLAAYACLRRSEIAALHTSDRHGDELRVVGKGQKMRRVGVGPELLDLLTRLEATRAGGYYFPGRVSGHRHPDSIYDVIKRLTRWHPHALRHRGATELYRQTKDLRGLQQMLGHSNLGTTERYISLADDSIRTLAVSNGFRSVG